MAMDSEEPVVVITGCSNGGIGHSLSLAHVENNCLVVATSSSLSSMRSLEDDSRVFLEELDVVSEESIREVIENVLKKYGRIDVLVNNVGMHLVGPLADSTVEQVFNTNVYGPLRLIQAVFLHMMSRRKGKIVNIGSVAALTPGPWASVYSASKAAVYALSNSLRVELSTYGVKVINVAPASITSNLGNSSLTRYEQMPEWKYFNQFEAAMRKRKTISQDPKSTPAEEFAKKTVAVVLKKSTTVVLLWAYIHNTRHSVLSSTPFQGLDL